MCTISLLITGSIQVLYDDNLGLIDFYPSSNTGVVYITEAELVSNSYRRRLAKLRKVKISSLNSYKAMGSIATTLGLFSVHFL